MSEHLYSLGCGRLTSRAFLTELLQPPVDVAVEVADRRAQGSCGTAVASGVDPVVRGGGVYSKDQPGAQWGGGMSDNWTERDRHAHRIGLNRLDYIGRRGGPCGDCLGEGFKLYANTSTWRRGIGGQALTTDVCDRCWGSGDESKPWPSHREHETLRARVARLEAELAALRDPQRPPAPEVLANAEQDLVHEELPGARPAKAMRGRRR